LATQDAAPTLEQRGMRRASRAGLYYVNSFDQGYTRRRCGRGFTYLSIHGKTLRSKRTRERIEALVIPPAWEDVWICPRANGHIQATGRDEGGRKQYLYHQRWQSVSAATNFDRLPLIGESLPRIRRRLRKDLNQQSLSRPRVVAAVVRIIDRGHLRVGNDRYTDKHGSHGATTLVPDQVDVDDISISLDFPSKSGRRRQLSLSDRKVAEVIDRCEELDAQFLFCFADDEGDLQPVDSTDVNEYLREITGSRFTAKDFRTWWGSVVAFATAAEALEDSDEQDGTKLARAAVAATAERLGNTKAVSRSSYIHPAILATVESGEFPELLKKVKAKLRDKSHRELTQEEARLVCALPLLNE